MKELPEDFDSQDADTQMETKEDVDDINRHKYYEMLCSVSVPGYYRVLCDAEPWSVPVSFLSSLWGNGFIPVRESLIRFSKAWSHYIGLSDATCPIKFTESELRVNAKDAEEWQALRDMETDFQRHLTVTTEGWVSADIYDVVAQANEEFKAHVLENCPDEDREDYIRRWPFRPTE